MAVCASSPSPFSSRLNPNAPFFVPAAFLAAEDFSPEWWHLVRTCPAFREYWLSERFDPEQLNEPEPLFSEDLDDFFLEFDLGPVSFIKQENIPPTTGMFPHDARELTKANLRELSINPKHERGKINRPIRVGDKPPRLVPRQNISSHIRKIQQPR